MASRNVSVRMSVKGVNKVKQDLKAIGKDGEVALKRLEKSAIPANRGLKALDYSSRKFNKSIVSLGKTMVAFAGVSAFVYQMKQSTAQALEFEKGMGEVSTLLDKVGMEDIPMLTKQMRGLSEQFGKSRTEEAKALYQAYSAGATSAADAMDLLTAANKLAIGGITTTVVGIDGITTALNAWGRETLTTQEVTDSFFVGMKRGKTTIELISTTIGKVAPLAAQAGVSLDEITASLAALTAQGFSSEQSITGLRAIIAMVIKPSEEAKKAAKSLGIEFNVASLEAKGFAGFLEHLKEKTGGSAERLSKLFGGVEALVPMLGLTGKAAGLFTSIMGDMGDKAGATEDAFVKMSTKTSHELDVIKVKFSNLSQEITENFFPVITQLHDNINPTIRGLRKFAENISEIAEGMVLPIKYLYLLGKLMGELATEDVIKLGFMDSDVERLVKLNEELEKLSKTNDRLIGKKDRINQLKSEITALEVTISKKQEIVELNKKQAELDTANQERHKQTMQLVKGIQKAQAAAHKANVDAEIEEQKEKDKAEALAEKQKETLKKQIALLGVKNKKLGEIAKGEKGIKTLLDEQYRIQAMIGRDLTKTEIVDLKEKIDLQTQLTAEIDKQAEAEAEKVKAREKADEEQKKRDKERADYWEDTVNGMVDSTSDYMRDEFRDALDGNKVEIKDFAKFFEGLMKDTIADIAKAMIFKPMVGSITGQMMGGLGLSTGGGGFSGVGSVGGAGAGGSGLGISDALSLAGLLKTGAAASPIMSVVGGAVAGGMTASMLGLEHKNQTVNTGASAAGALIGTVLLGPGIGTFIGSFAGTALAGLFGGSKGKKQLPYQKTYVSQYANDNWRIGIEGEGHGGSRSTGWQYIKFLEGMQELTGMVLKQGTGRLGELGSFHTGAGGVTTQAGLMHQFTGAFSSAVGRGMFSNVAPALERIIKETAGKADEMEAGIALWLQAKLQMEESLKSLSVVANDNMGQFEIALKSLNAQFAAMLPQASDLGVSSSKVTKAKNAQITALRKQFNEQNRLAILMRSDPYTAAMDEFEKWADFLRSDAQALGADIVQAEELIGLRRLEIVEQYGDKISEAQKGILSNTLQGFLDEMRGTTAYGTSPLEALTEAERQFNEVRADALTGTVEAIERLPDALKRLLEVSSEVFAHGSEYWERRSFGESTLENVIGNIPGFATGGYHSGGLRIVGERGAEIEATGSARYFTAEQIASGSTNMRNVEQKLDRLIAVMEGLRQQSSHQTVDTIQAISSIDSGIDDMQRALRKIA